MTKEKKFVRFKIKAHFHRSKLNCPLCIVYVYYIKETQINNEKRKTFSSEVI